MIILSVTSIFSQHSFIKVYKGTDNDNQLMYSFNQEQTLFNILQLEYKWYNAKRAQLRYIY